MFPSSFFGRGYFGFVYWPGGVNEHAGPDIICFTFIIDGVTSAMFVDGVSSMIDIERDLANLHLIECN